jgi:hypothetical protein
MSDSGFLSDEDESNASFHLPAPVFSDAEGEVGAPEPSIEEGMKAESAKLAALQAEIIAQQAELAASQSAATQVAPAEPEAVSSKELRGFMQQIASSFGAMQQDNTTRKAEWEEFQQKVNAERVELTATIMDRIGMMESESEALRAEISESQGRSSNVSCRDVVGRRATIHGHVEGIRLPKGWGDGSKAKFNDKPSENMEFLDVVTFDVQVLDPKIQGLAIYHQLGGTVQSAVRRLAKENDSLIKDADVLI